MKARFYSSISSLLLGLFLLTGCMVSNKQVAYLQKDQDYKHTAPKDQVVRTYALQAPAEYHLQKGDQLHIKVNSLTPAQYDIFAQAQSLGNTTPQTPQMLGGPQGSLLAYEVDPTGHITLPLAGEVLADGKSLKELEGQLQQQLSAYLKDPVVSVRLSNYRFTVLGEIRREGLYSTFNDRLSVLEAIGMAGGFDDLANREQVKIIRQGHNGEEATVQYINLLDENFVGSPYFFVQPNDVLVVGPVKQRPARKYLAQDISIISSVVALLVSVITLSTR